MASIHKQDLISLADEKAKDASLLLENGSYSNAYYLAGYAIEIGLKVLIASEFQRDTLPDKTFVTEIYVHDLKRLIGFAGLQAELEIRQRADVAFAANWAIVADWSEESRYEGIDSIRATAMLSAVRDEQSGIFPWLKTHW